MQAYNGGCHCGALTISDADGALRIDAKVDAFTAPIAAISYDNETASLRGEGRKSRWTPVEAFNVRRSNRCRG